MSRIHENLRRIRDSLKSSGRWKKYRQIAAYLQSQGVDYGTSAVGHWFSGRNEVPVEALRGLAHMLECQIADIVEGDPSYVDKADTKLVVKLYERLSPEKQAALLALLETMSGPAPSPPS